MIFGFLVLLLLFITLIYPTEDQRFLSRAGDYYLPSAFCFA